MTLQIIAVYFLSICLLIGAVFMLVGSIGLLRFSGTMARMHAPTKAGTLGVGALLLGSMIYFDVFGKGWSIHEMLIMAFLFVTAPISANFMAKVNIHRRACEAPPPPLIDRTWATLDVPPEDPENLEPEQP